MHRQEDERYFCLRLRLAPKMDTLFGLPVGARFEDANLLYTTHFAYRSSFAYAIQHRRQPYTTFFFELVVCLLTAKPYHE